jgi:hypothetical protein
MICFLFIPWTGFRGAVILMEKIKVMKKRRRHQKNCTTRDLIFTNFTAGGVSNNRDLKYQREVSGSQINATAHVF